MPEYRRVANKVGLLNGSQRGLPALQRELPLAGRVADAAQARLRAAIADAETVADIRRAVGRSQQEVADAMRISQKAVSQLENRRDLRLSTLRRYFEALGMELSMTAIAAGTEIKLCRLALPRANAESSPIGERESARVAAHVVARSADHD